MRNFAASLLFWALPCVALAQPVENTPSLCQNQVDDDGDGLVDCADDGCSRLIFCVNYQPQETSEVECQNGEDDDNDGAVDCDDDGCADVCGQVQSVRLGQPGTQGIYQPRVQERGPEVGYLEHESDRNLPYGYAERPMTFLEGMLVPQVGFQVRNVPLGGLTPDPYFHLAAGLSYGLVDFLQITVRPVAFNHFLDDTNFGSPSVSTTLRFFSEEVIELGLYANVVIPLTTLNVATIDPLPTSSISAAASLSDVAQLDAALMMRLRFADLVRIDLTLPLVNVVFRENLGSLDPVANLVFDLRVGFSITDYAYAGVYTGALVPGQNYDTPFIPLGFFAGAVIPGPSRRGPLADIGVRFGWPTFANVTSSSDVVNGDLWQLTFDARFFTYLLP